METAFIFLNPELPWRCSLYIRAARAFNTILVLVSLSLVVYFGNVSLKYYKRYQQKQKDEMFFMVGKIVELLQNNAGEDEDSNFLVINHVRDMILPINDRKRECFLSIARRF